MRDERKGEQCPKGHALQPSRALPGTCSGCKRWVQAGEPLLGCRRCDWYLCQACHGAPRCPTGHVMRPAKSMGVSCCGCSRHVAPGESAMMCPECKWICCRECGHRLRGGQARDGGNHRHLLGGVVGGWMAGSTLAGDSLADLGVKLGELQAFANAKVSQELADLQELASEWRTHVCCSEKCQLGVEVEIEVPQEMPGAAARRNGKDGVDPAQPRRGSRGEAVVEGRGGVIEQEQVLKEQEETNVSQSVADPRVILSGQVRAAAPTDEKAWAQCMQSLKSTLSGGNVFVVGREHHAVRSPGQIGERGSEEQARDAFEELSHALAAEWFAQAASALPLDEREQQKVREIANRVVPHLTSAVGMQIAAAHDNLKGVCQPTFAVCVCNGQVHVMTLAFVAFVGESVSGESPGEKPTPLLCRLLTEDLATATGEATSVKYVVREVGANVKSTEEYLASIDPCLLLEAEGRSSHGRCRGHVEL